ncbi:MAG: hypothetical protein CMJ71_03495 [Planctomycetaceae bacterium]|nr:hypothetical protein [Planctomycetaceae bacterium]
MNQIAVLAAVETVSYPPRTTRAILRGKYISQGKKTMRPNAPRWANQQFADSGGIAHALTSMHSPTHPVASAII